MTTALSMTSAIARTCPFVGPRSFRFGEPLFGRDREISRLLNLLIAERIVLMFSPSGAGKSSLIQAGLIPALRAEEFLDLPIIRVKQPTHPTALGAFQINRFVRSTLESLERPRPGRTENPPEHLASRGELAPSFRQWADALGPTADGRTPDLVLIFDQFEEILTTDPADTASKKVFFDQLGSVLKNPGLWALFAMREEYVAALEPYLNQIPRRLSSRFRLDLLDADAAREAFDKTFRSVNISVAPKAAGRLVEDLCLVNVQRPDGTSEVVPGPHVEPVHLQIVGLRLWDRYGSDPEFSWLEERHLSGTEEGVHSALAGYYADKVREIGEASGVGERTIREWCEHQLLTDQGLRGQVRREPGQTRGLPEAAIRQLIDAFLVRAEERHRLTWYELAHDRLIEPVRKNNQEWRQKHLHASVLQTFHWNLAGQPDELLLRGAELKNVEAWASANDRLLTDSEREFIAKSKAEEWSKRRIQRYVAAWSLTVLGLVAILLLIAYLWLAAVSARDTAIQAEGDAKTQRQRADRLAIELTIDRGISLCQQARTDDGLLWLMHGLEQARETKTLDPTLDHLVRLELATWRAELTSLRWFQRSSDTVVAVGLSADGRTALTGSADRTARLWDVASGQPKGPPLKHEGPVIAVALSADGRIALTGSADTTARLWDVASGQPKGPPLKHEGPVRSVALSADGRTALTGSADETARLWDVISGQPKGPPLKLEGPIGAVGLSADGRTALIGSGDETARLWDVASGQPKGPPLKHEGPVIAVALSADGRTALTGSVDATGRLWDVASGQPKGPPLKHDDWVLAVGLSADGRIALTGSADTTARLWDVASGQPKGPPLKHENLVLAVGLSADGRIALTGSADRTARLWDVASGQLKGSPLKHEGPVRAVGLSADGRTALTGSDDKMARLWDVASGRSQGPPLKHKGSVLAVRLSADGRTALTGSLDKTGRLWDVASGQPKGPPLKHDDLVLAVALSADGRTALTGSADRTGRLWDVASGQPKGPPLKHNGWVVVVALSADGRTALTGSDDNTGRLWDVASVRPKGPPLKHESSVCAVALSADGRTALTGSVDKTGRLWDVASGQPKGPPLKHEGPVRAVALSADGRTALTGSDDNTGRLWDIASGQPKGPPLKHEGPIVAVGLSADGRTALTGSDDNTARLWNVQTQQPVGLPLGHRGLITRVAFSPDGTMSLTSSRDGTAQLWWTETQRPIGAPFLHSGWVNSAAFSPDGRWIATASADKTARLWQTPAAVEGSLDRLALWVRVVTRKELNQDSAIRTVDLETWQKDRQKLDRLGGPPDRHAASGAARSPAR